MITTAAQRQCFEENGYLLVPDLFSRQEIEAVLSDEARLDTQRQVLEENPFHSERDLAITLTTDDCLVR